MERKKKLKKPLKQPPPINQEKSYKKDLNKVIDELTHAVNKFLIEDLPYLISDFNKHKNNIYLDDAREETDKAFDKIKIYLDGKINADNIAKNHASEINSYNRVKFTEQIKHIFGIDIFLNNPWLKDQLNVWVGTNVDLIKDLQSKALQEIKYQVFSGFTKGLTAKKISENIYNRIDVAKSRADFIGRDQTSKLNGQLNMERQKEIGIDSYIWNTAHDERVRESHKENDGKKFYWDSPPAETGHPGEDYNCRCIALMNAEESYLKKYL
jgi:SPP1 gp7 family putative phage head morphogenesis protein